MRIAVLYDIHANLPALEAVITELNRTEIDLIVVGGDVIPGPMPRETLSCLLALDIPTRFILGNGEVAVLQVMAGREPARVPEKYRPVIHWTAEQLQAEYGSVLSEWPKTDTVAVEGLGQVLFCHATPRDEDEIFTRETPAGKLLPIFENIGAQIVVCGHTHMQFDRMIRGTRVVNAGSVGMPFGEPGAYWLLLGPEVQLRRTEYDFASAADRIRKTNYPQAEDFASHNVLRNPSESQMLAMFSRVELK